MHHKWEVFILTIIISFSMAIFNTNCKQKVSNQPQKKEAKKIPPEKSRSFIAVTLFTIGINEAESETEEPFQFASIGNAECDTVGNIFVLDDKLHCVRVFDKKGKFIKQMFQRGQGPKELANPEMVIYNSFAKSLFVINEHGHSIKTFDLDGNFLEKLLPPGQIFHPCRVISPEQLLFINNAAPNEHVYSNFIVWNFKKKEIDREIAVFDNDERTDIYNHKQVFAIHNGTLWTSHIHEMAVTGYDLKTGRRINKIEMKGDFKKNKITDFKYMGFKGIGILAYNFLQPVLLGDEIFVIYTTQDYKIDDREMLKIMQNPVFSRKSFFRIKDNKRFQKIFDFDGDESMRFQTTYENRIIFSVNNPYPHLKVVEVRKGD